MAGMKQQIEQLTSQVRELKETIRVYDLNYCYLRDLVVDLGCYVKDEEEIPQSLMDEFVKFEWKDNGQHVPSGSP
jgi:hypothetical protein